MFSIAVQCKRLISHPPLITAVMDDTAINIPIDVRSHEQNQLTEFVPKLVTRFMNRQTEQMESKSDELNRVYDEHIEGMDGESYLSMPIDDWRTLISSLSNVDDGLRGWWLQKKLVSRLRDKLEDIQ